MNFIRPSATGALGQVVDLDILVEPTPETTLTAIAKIQLEPGQLLGIAVDVLTPSPSFIRDAESHPERCSLEKLVLLVNGLGLRLEISGLSELPKNKAQRGSA